MQKRILEMLNTLEVEQQITVLYAVESGSRAWGFASPDSDYDVRFVYHRPLSEYLRVDPHPDTVELPIQDALDFSGWDMFNALRLFRASNPPLLEWLHSPLVYCERGPLASELRALAQTGYSPRRMMYHYLSMAKKNFRLSIQDREAITLKKYLYVLRPLLCFQWIERHGTPPPTLFAEVRRHTELPSEVNSTLEELLRHKQQAKEADLSTPNPVLDAFIGRELERAGEVIGTALDSHMASAPLNTLAQTVLGCAVR